MSPNVVLMFCCSLLVINSACIPSSDDNKVYVYAAISAAPAIEEIVKNVKDIQVTVNSASSSVLARQIENGAPADIFISADLAWIESLRNHQKLRIESVKPLLKNSLVVVATSTKVQWPPKITSSLRIGIADPDHVPLGRYAKETLTHEKLWSKLRTNYVFGKNAHSTLRYAERNEVELSIVYKSDAQKSDLEVIHELPTTTSTQIIYPIALTSPQIRQASRQIYERILRSEAIFRAHGFEIP
ncbi:MAG: molybdate ABC transporter substrate-binding protein [Myxococcota bacterium]|nr:molybdate ABC transporter substrate-binding protein [Myxococcota bacterium]